MNQQLKSCPFCNGHAVLDGKSDDVRVRCETGCGAVGAVHYFDSDDDASIERAESDAIAGWNRRHVPAPQSTKDEWWYPVLTDAAWIARIRADYPDQTRDLSDEAIRDNYAEGYKYADTWDHLGDAREAYEALADAYIALVASLENVQ